MKRILTTMAVLAAYPLIAAGSCATTSPPPVRVVEKVVPVVQPCPDARKPREPLPDTREAVRAALAAGDLVEANRLVWAGWPLHWQRHDEDDAQIAACAGGAAPPRPDG